MSLTAGARAEHLPQQDSKSAVAGSSVLAQNNQVLRLVYAEDWAPYSFRNQDGKADGILVALLEDLLVRQMGLVVEHNVLPWKRAQAMVESGRMDAMLAVPTKSRLGYAQRTSSVFYRFNTLAYIAKKSALAKPLLSAQAPLKIPGVRCILMAGDKSSARVAARNQVECDVVRSARQALKMLASNREDVFIHEPVAVKRVLNDSHFWAMYGNDIAIHHEPLESVSSVFMVSKKSSFLMLAPLLDKMIAAGDIQFPAAQSAEL